MIVQSTSVHHVEVDFVDPDDIYRLCNAAGIVAKGVCKVSVIFVREGLTDEECYEKFEREARARIKQLDAQLEFTADC